MFKEKICCVYLLKFIKFLGKMQSKQKKAKLFVGGIDALSFYLNKKLHTFYINSTIRINYEK